MSNAKTIQPGFNTPQCHWSLLNRFRTNKGYCTSFHKKWSLATTDKCPCGKWQTMLHIVSSCPQTKLKGSVQWLYSDDFDIAVQRLKTHSSRMHTTTTAELSTVRRHTELVWVCRSAHSLTVDTVLHCRQTQTHQNAASSSGRHMRTSCLISSLVFILNHITTFTSAVLSHSHHTIYSTLEQHQPHNNTVHLNTQLRCCTYKITTEEMDYSPVTFLLSFLGDHL